MPLHKVNSSIHFLSPEMVTTSRSTRQMAIGTAAQTFEPASLADLSASRLFPRFQRAIGNLRRRGPV